MKYGNTFFFTFHNLWRPIAYYLYPQTLWNILIWSKIKVIPQYYDFIIRLIVHSKHFSTCFYLRGRKMKNLFLVLHIHACLKPAFACSGISCLSHKKMWNIWSCNQKAALHCSDDDDDVFYCLFLLFMYLLILGCAYCASLNRSFLLWAECLPVGLGVLCGNSSGIRQ